jgi:hypothetical protein
MDVAMKDQFNRRRPCMALNHLKKAVRALQAHGIKDRIAHRQGRMVDNQKARLAVLGHCVVKPLKPFLTEKAPIQATLEAVEHDDLPTTWDGQNILSPAQVACRLDPWVILKHLKEWLPGIVIA